MPRYIDAAKVMERLSKIRSIAAKSIPDEIFSAGISRGIDRAETAIEMQPAADVVEIPEGGIGNLSDGYHTFNELYHHRAVLFSVICNLLPDKAWKSKRHDTGDMYDGMFIVGIETTEGQATYHYDIYPYWDMFKVKELEKAPKWDGHTPKDAIDRIAKISADVEEVRHGTWQTAGTFDDFAKCSVCGLIDHSLNEVYSRGTYNYCPNCGAKMDGERREG